VITTVCSTCAAGVRQRQIVGRRVGHGRLLVHRPPLSAASAARVTRTARAEIDPTGTVTHASA
jgi:hypothetical protein